MLRKASVKDIQSIMKIVDNAKISLKNSNISQWQDGYPNEKDFLSDIKNNNFYVYELDKNILGISAIISGPDKDYKKIYEGNWLTGNNNDNYIVLHRIAVDEKNKRKKIASLIIKEAINMAKIKKYESIRVDTHRDNKAMQNLLVKNNFIKCGIVYIDNKNERIAFELKI